MDPARPLSQPSQAGQQRGPPPISGLGVNPEAQTWVGRPLPWATVGPWNDPVRPKLAHQLLLEDLLPFLSSAIPSRPLLVIDPRS